MNIFNYSIFYWMTYFAAIKQHSSIDVLCSDSSKFDSFFRQKNANSNGYKYKPGQQQVEADQQQKVSASGDGGVHWVLLAAGSNGWDNYRHQADLSHAYQVVKRHGIPAERIVTMMYDDIARSELNPTPGRIYNHPEGTDVYEGVIVDYRREEVNAGNFLAVLSGNSSRVNGKGSGKVIKSGPDDHIFVYFVDHGGPGILSFPRTRLNAKDLVDTLVEMNSKKRFAKMVLYIEACFSGSMLNGLLPSNINVYATTAANAIQSSYACYWDQLRSTFLGDVYSVSWLEDSDRKKLNLETLDKQYEIVKSLTDESQVCLYGDKNLGNESLDNFQGELGQKFNLLPIIVVPKVPKDAVPSTDVPLVILHRKLEVVKDVFEREVIKDKIKMLQMKRDQVKMSMGKIAKDAHMFTFNFFKLEYDTWKNRDTDNYLITKHSCYKWAVKIYDKKCFDVDQDGYTLKSLRTLLDLCESGMPGSAIQQSIVKVCRHLPHTSSN